ncbi:unnamed protein product [Ambrosiozyma monospora]|uniref:Unnamed protein product n=1 Tax=Ambrosiozyma monospora TaxID=43982 RepID=A0A9W6Z2A7_AMBMO|nr:unnamed protein product [Ambrosiozyma monospora]
MTDNNTAANVLGTIGTVLWCIQLSPQIYYLWKHKDATGFPPTFMFLWALSGIPFSIYFVMSDSYIPMQVQPCMFECLCAIAWIQSMYYPPYSYPKKRIILFTVLFFSCAIGMQVGFGVWLKRVYANGTHWPSLIFGIIASIILAAGLVPPYIELSKRQGRVVGINFVFLIMDCSGAVFSMASNLVGDIDIMGMILYAIIIVMEIGIMTSQIIWLLRFRVIRKKKDIDDDDDDDEDDDGEAGSYEKGKAKLEADDEEKQTSNL